MAAEPFHRPDRLRLMKRLLTERVSRWRIRAEVWINVLRKHPLRIIVGAGGSAYPGWISTDVNVLDLTIRSDWQWLFSRSRMDAILAEHVWEHLSDDEAAKATALAFDYLKCGGHFRIAVPDGYHPDKDYIQRVRPRGDGPGADDHKRLYTYRSLSELLEAAGFRVHVLEYWDEHGIFHAEEWDPKDGMISRSKRFDPRNSEGLTFTSLIIDATKPGASATTERRSGAPADRRSEARLRGRRNSHDARSALGQ